MAKPAQWGVGALVIFSLGPDTPVSYRVLKIRSASFFAWIFNFEISLQFSYPYSKVYSTRDLILREEHVQLLKKLIPGSKENELSQSRIYPDLKQGMRVTLLTTG